MLPKDILIAVGIILLWSINLLILKIFSPQISIDFFNLMRFLCCVPLLFFFRKPTLSFVKLLLICLFWNALNFFFLGMALQYGAKVGTIAFVYQTCSFFSVLFCFLLLQEKPKIHQLLGMSLSFGGVALLFGEGFLQQVIHTADPWISILFVCCAAMSWGVGITLIKKYRLFSDVASTVWMTSMAALPMLGIIMLKGGTALLVESYALLTGPIILGILYACYVANLLGNCLFFGLLKKYPSATVTPFMLLLPLFSCLLSYCFLEERFGMVQILAFTVIMLGLIVNQLKREGKK